MDPKPPTLSLLNKPNGSDLPEPPIVAPAETTRPSGAVIPYVERDGSGAKPRLALRDGLGGLPLVTWLDVCGAAEDAWGQPQRAPFEKRLADAGGLTISTPPGTISTSSSSWMTPSAPLSELARPVLLLALCGGVVVPCTIVGDDDGVSRRSSPEVEAVVVGLVLRPAAHEATSVLIPRLDDGATGARADPLNEAERAWWYARLNSSLWSDVGGLSASSEKRSAAGDSGLLSGIGLVGGSDSDCERERVVATGIW